MAEQKEFIIIAGSNGSGKTTFVQNIFPKFVSENRFLNADQFAVKLNSHDVARRYQRGLTNFRIYSEVVDEYEVFLADETPSLIFSKNKHKGMIIKDNPRFEKFELSIQSVRD